MKKQVYLIFIIFTFLGDLLDANIVKHSHKGAHKYLYSTKVIVPRLKLFQISIPKCGTHLLQKCISLFYSTKFCSQWLVLSQQDVKKLAFNCLGISHSPCIASSAQNVNGPGVKGIFIYRDPRDFLVSAAYWAKKHPLDNQKISYYQSLSISKIILELIYDYGALFDLKYYGIVSGTINDFYRAYLPWRQHPNFYTVTFEHLVGPKGGGDLSAQLTEIANIARHLGVKINRKKAMSIAEKMFGNTYTFREGKVGQWKRYFTKECCEAFKKIAGQLLIDLGYEKDSNWLNNV